MKKIWTDIIKVAVLIGLIILGDFAWYHKGRVKGRSEAIESVTFVHDTTTVYDTITRLKPVYLTSTVVDSIPYPVVVHNTDTLWAQLPRTVREYGDSTFYAQVSGVNPSLDRIDIFRKTQYINNTVYIPQKDGRRDFFEVDARVMYSGSPYAPVTANIGRLYGPLEVYVGGGYDFLQKAPLGQVGARLKLKF